MTMLFITHDFGVVNDIADDVAVMFKVKLLNKEVLQMFKKSKTSLHQSSA